MEVHQSQQTVGVVVVLIVSPQQVQNVPEDAKDGRVSTCDADHQNARSTRRDAGQVLIIRTVQTWKLHKPSTSRELSVVSAVLAEISPHLDRAGFLRQWDIMVPRHADDRRRRSTFLFMQKILKFLQGHSTFPC